MGGSGPVSGRSGRRDGEVAIPVGPGEGGTRLLRVTESLVYMLPGCLRVDRINPRIFSR